MLAKPPLSWPLLFDLYHGKEMESRKPAHLGWTADWPWRHGELKSVLDVGNCVC